MLIAAILAASCAFIGPTGPVVAQAQQAHLPIVGRLFGTVGAEIRGGTVIDWNEEDLRLSPTAGSRARLGLHHVLSQKLSMNAEGAIGMTYYTPHTIGVDGEADARMALDWSATILARYLRIGSLSGWTFAGGVHYRSAYLADGTLLQFGVETRVGYNVWTDDERFLIVEFGLHAPLIEGLRVSQQTLTGEQPPVPGSWTQPSASLGIQWAF